MTTKENFSVKREIINAFIKLMSEKSYMDITVTDIVHTAQVARASFYRNFKSINDVIDTIANELSEEFIEDIYPILSSSDERKWRTLLFNHFYRFTSKQHHMDEFLPKNVAVIFSRLGSLIQQKKPNISSDTLHDKYMAIGKIGLINSIMKKWIDDGMQETPEEMINYIMSFITLF